MLHTFADVAEVMPAIAHVPAFGKQDRSAGIARADRARRRREDRLQQVPLTALSVVLPARRVAETSFWSRPQPAMIAVSPTRASRLVRIGTGFRGRSSAITTIPTSNEPGVLKLVVG